MYIPLLLCLKRWTFFWKNRNVISISELLWFCFTLLCDWSTNLAPLSQPIRYKTKTNPDLVARFFQRFRLFGWFNVDVFMDCCLAMMQITRELPITDMTKLNNMAVARIIVVGKLNWRSMMLCLSAEKWGNSCILSESTREKQAYSKLQGEWLIDIADIESIISGPFYLEYKISDAK